MTDSLLQHLTSQLDANGTLTHNSYNLQAISQCDKRDDNGAITDIRTADEANTNMPFLPTSHHYEEIFHSFGLCVECQMICINAFICTAC